MKNDLQRYLDVFAAIAASAGLEVRRPGRNWVPLAPLVRGSHVSLSVTAHKIRVNLNNDDDRDRVKFRRLSVERSKIHEEIGEGLLWDEKDGRNKTVVRATRDGGYADDDWEGQHRWAVDVMQRFETAFGRRLR